MSDPILSREEALELASDAFGIDYARLDARFEKYASLIEAAVLEKVCGEPVAFTSETGLRLLELAEECRVWSPDSPLRRQRDIPLYALTRSKP